MKRDLHSRKQQQCMQLAKDSKNQIPRSAGCQLSQAPPGRQGKDRNSSKSCGFSS